MFHDTTFPPPDDRLAAIMRELNALDAKDIGKAIDAMIATLDARAGDPDLEDEPDCCEAGDDRIVAGPVLNRGLWLDRNQTHCFIDLRPGNEEDAEADRPPSYRLDQSAALFVDVASGMSERAA